MQIHLSKVCFVSNFKPKVIKSHFVLIGRKSSLSIFEKKSFMSRKQWLAGIAASAYLTFVLLLSSRIDNDLTANAGFVLRYKAAGLIPPYLFQLLLYPFAFFSDRILLLAIVGAGICGLAVLYKFRLWLRFFSTIDNKFWWLSLVMLFVFVPPMFEQPWYLGQLPANLFHNPTTLAVLPFSILLFWQSHQYLSEKHTHFSWQMMWLCVLNVAIKPSFFFCFAPVFGLYLLSNRLRWDGFLRASLPVVAGGVVLLVQYWAFFSQSAFSQAVGEQSSGIAFGFAEVWRHYSDNILFSFVRGMVFPLTFMLFYGKSALKASYIRYAWVLYFLAMTLFIFVHEQGPRFIHGNFGWQTIICNHILHGSLLFFLAKNYASLRSKWQTKVLIGLLILLVVSGIAYTVRLGYTGLYL